MISISQIKNFVDSFFGKNIFNGKAIISASLLSYLNLFVSTIVGLLIVPILVKNLGTAQYGIYILLISSIGYLSLFNLGFTDAIIRYVSEYHALNAVESIKKIISTATYFFLFIGIIILIICGLIIEYLPYYFNLDSKYYSIFRIGFMTLAFNFVISLQGSLLSSIIAGYQKNHIVKIFNLIQIITYNGLIYLLVKFGFGILGITYSAILSAFLFLFLCLFYIYRNNIVYTISTTFFDKNLLSYIFPYSFRVFIMSLTSQILYRSDAIVIGVILGSVSLTSFDLMYKICFIVATLSTVFSDVLFPTYARLNILNDKEQINKLLQINLFIGISIVSFFTMFLYIWGKSIFLIWVGNKVEIPMNVFFLMLTINFLHAIGPCYTVLKAIGRVKLIMISSIVNSIFNIILSIYLAKKIGLSGVILATIFSHLTTDTLISFYSIKKYLNISIKKLMYNAIIPPILISMIVYPFCNYIFYLNNKNNISLVSVFFSLIISLIIFIIFSFYFVKKNKKNIF